MEDVDGIILLTLRQVGCELPAEITSMAVIDGEMLCLTASHCLRTIDPSIKVSKTLPKEAGMRFRAATSIAQAIKKLGFKEDIGFHQLMYPDEKGTRKLFSFLIEHLPQITREESSISESLGPQAILNNKIVAEIKKWIKYQWTPPFATPPETLRQYHAFNSCLLTLPPTNQTTVSAEQKKYIKSPALPLVTQQPCQRCDATSAIIEHNRKHWIMTQEKTIELFNSQNEDSSTKTARRDGIQKLITDALRSARRGAADSSAESFEDLLTHIMGGDTASDTNHQIKKGKGTFFSHQTDFGLEKSSAVVEVEALATDAASSEQRKNKEEIQAKRAEELELMTNQLSTIQREVATIENKINIQHANIRQIENELSSEKNNIEALEDEYKLRKKTLDLLSDVEGNLKELRSISAASATRLLKLGKEWEDHRRPMIDSYRDAVETLDKRKGDYKVKVAKIKEMRKEMKGMLSDLEEKEDRYKLLLEEYERLPKNVNRVIFIRRIMEIVKNVKKQKIDINKILFDTRQVQKEINTASETLDRSFAVTEDFIFKDAKNDEHCKRAYVHLLAIHDTFGKVIRLIEETGATTNDIRLLESKITSMEAKDVENNLTRIKADLKAVKGENKELKAKLAQTAQ